MKALLSSFVCLALSVTYAVVGLPAVTNAQSLAVERGNKDFIGITANGPQSCALEIWAQAGQMRRQRLVARSAGGSYEIPRSILRSRAGNSLLRIRARCENARTSVARATLKLRQHNNRRFSDKRLFDQLRLIFLKDQLQLRRIRPDLSLIQLTEVRAHKQDALLVGLQNGLILEISTTAEVAPSTVLDLSDLTSASGERGLLAFALRGAVGS